MNLALAPVIIITGETMASSQQPMTEALKKAIAESGMAHIAIERATGVKRASIMRFMRGETSLRLDLADRLATYFGLRLTAQTGSINMNESTRRDSPTLTVPKLRAWVAKANAQLPGEWHWRYYFEGEDDSASGWDWVRDRRSLKYIRESIEKYDVIVCYQVDQNRSILGLTLAIPKAVAVLGLVDGQREAIQLTQPVSVFQLRRASIDPACFKQGAARSVHPITSEEFAGIVRVIGNFNPDQIGELNAWLKQARELQHHAV